MQYDIVKETIEWDKGADVEIIRNNSINVAKHDYQIDLNKPQQQIKIKEKNYNFSETVQSWSDYLYSRYHSRTINQIKSCEHNQNENGFDCYTVGAEIWRAEYFEDDFGNKIRQYIEECNNCQGFQILFDCTDGFSGLTMKCLEYLNDEYKKTLLTIPIFTPKLPKFSNSDINMSDTIRIINTIMSYSNLIEQSSLILPISTMTGEGSWRSLNKQRKVPLLNYLDTNLYQTSAILATYIDTISLHYRLHNATYSNYLVNFCTDLTNYGRKLVSAGMALPFKMEAKQDLIDCLDHQPDEYKLFTQLSPNSEVGNDNIIQSICLRGIPKTRLKKPQTIAKHQLRMAAYKCDSISEMLQFYFECNTNASKTHATAIENGMIIKKPYPFEIFDERLNSMGFLNDFHPMEEDESSIQSTPVLAVAQCSNDLSATIETLHREGSRIKISKISRFKGTGLEYDEYNDVLEKLLEFKDNYDNGFEL